MIPHLLYYQLAVFGCLWLFVMLCWAWPSPCLDERPKADPTPPVRPDPMPPTKRRPRAIDTSMHFCPHHGCSYRGWLGLGNLRANGHPSGGPWRQLQCTSCEGYVLETHGTLFHGKRVAVDPNTVLQWLVEAVQQLRALSRYVLRDLHLTQVQ